MSEVDEKMSVRMSTTPNNIAGMFERVYVVDLSCRTVGWSAFHGRLPPDWPFGHPYRVEPINADRLPPPTSWGSTKAEWSLHQTMIQVIGQCLEADLNSVLFVDESTIFPASFVAEASRFVELIPEDWAIIHFGGELLDLDYKPPQRVNEFVYRAFKVRPAKAFALRGKETLHHAYWSLVSRRADDHRCWTDRLLEIQTAVTGGQYVPREWVLSEAAAAAGVEHTNAAASHLSAHEITSARISLPMVAVLEPFSAYSSGVAGMLHVLGINVGAEFPDTKVGSSQDFYEDGRLGRICRNSYRQPMLTEENAYADRVTLLRHWAAEHCRRIPAATRMAGGKHPTLCLMGPELMEAWNEPRFIFVERDLAECAISIHESGWGWPMDVVKSVLRYMVTARNSFLKDRAPSVLTIDERWLRTSPHEVVDSVCEFLDITPTESKRSHAVSMLKTLAPPSILHPACQYVKTRDALVGRLCRGGIIAETGVFLGEFSDVLLEECQPTELHLIDPWTGGGYASGDKDGKALVRIDNMQRAWEFVQRRYRCDKRVRLHRQTGALALSMFCDDYFDLVYIDSDHEYDNTTIELEIAKHKVKSGGWIAGHDYHLGFGVFCAVNAFCQRNGFTIDYITDDGCPTFAIRNTKNT